MSRPTCIGCGATMQNEDKEKVGYTPKDITKEDVSLCMRCFRLKHYNDIAPVDMEDEDFLELVSQVRHQSGLIVHLIDVFDINGSMLDNLSRIVGDKPVILVANKVDLLPKLTNRHKLKLWLQQNAKNVGVKIVDVFLMSSLKGEGIDEVKEAIETHRKKNNVYIVGTTNVGKSTFVNRLIRDTTGNADVITTSYFPGTTLGFIDIPLDENSSLIDTPGIVNRKQITHYLSKKDIKQLTPKKELKPKTYQLNEGQTLFVGGLARLDFIKGSGRHTFICYFSNQLYIHRTKLEQADELYRKHVGEMLSPPSEDISENELYLKPQTYQITEDHVDVVFPGLGWISIQDSPVTVCAHSMENVPVSLRTSLI